VARAAPSVYVECVPPGARFHIRDRVLLAFFLPLWAGLLVLSAVTILRGTAYASFGVVPAPDGQGYPILAEFAPFTKVAMRSLRSAKECDA
jgi:hypothetical protein